MSVALSADKRQQILDLLDEEPSDHRIARTVGVGTRTVQRYRAGEIPAQPGPATDDQCRNGHRYPENRRVTKKGAVDCYACRRERQRAWDRKNPWTSRYPKPTPPPRPTPPPIRGNWRDLAICRKEKPDLFFPVGRTAPALLQTEAARAVCYRCPALNPCARWALETGVEHGVWGGYDERQRRAALRRRARNRARKETAA